MQHRFAFNAMGSPCELTLSVPTRSQAKRAAEQAIADIRSIEARYSRYRDDSITSAINRTAAKGATIHVDAETAALINYADTCYKASGGLFDITSGVLRNAWNFMSRRLPAAETVRALLERVGWDKVEWSNPWLTFSVAGMEIDFGGIGKEYAADRAAIICLNAGIHHGFVNLGGDIRVFGPQQDGSPWRIGIKHPRNSGALLTTVMLYQGGLASSGHYERCIEIEGRLYGHILDPKTGWPVQGLIAVSVVAECCLLAGSASTIALLKGGNGIDWLEGQGLPYAWMDDEGQTGVRLSKP